MTDLLLTRDKHLLFFTTDRTKKKVRYNLQTKEMSKFDEKKQEWFTVRTQYHFFGMFTMQDIKSDEPKFMKLLEKARKLNPTCQSVSTFVSRLNESLVYENYEEQGIETQCEVYSSWGHHLSKTILEKPLSFYNKDVITFFKEHKTVVTKDIEDAFIEHFDFLTKLVVMFPLFNLDDDKIEKLFYEITSDDYSRRKLISLIEEHNYDIKSLFDYFFNYLEPFENLKFIKAINELKDYYEMAKVIGRNVKKYPKYLRSMHDIITANYNAFKKEYNEVMFLNRIKDNLEFKGKEFCVFNPRTTKDIISEGTSLNHCVSSYVEKIINGLTYILFLRKIQEPETSLVTLEINGNKLVQAKGSYNRQITKEEEKFLMEYCKAKKIMIGGVL